jgi:hypothetical protein
MESYELIVNLIHATYSGAISTENTQKNLKADTMSNQGIHIMFMKPLIYLS